MEVRVKLISSKNSRHTKIVGFVAKGCAIPVECCSNSILNSK
jgi:hypothetical protein